MGMGGHATTDERGAVPALCGIKARHKLGYREKRPLQAEDDHVLAGDDLCSVIAWLDRTLRRRLRAGLGACTASAPSGFTRMERNPGLDQCFFH